MKPDMSLQLTGKHVTPDANAKAAPDLPAAERRRWADER
jgi:hypothetical protein